MFKILDHIQFSQACFPRWKNPENWDQCFSMDFDSQPAVYGKLGVRLVMDGVSSGNGGEAVRQAFPVFCCDLAGKLAANSRKLSEYAEQDNEAEISRAIHRLLLESFRQANAVLRAQGGFQTTVSAAILFHRNIYTANLGDSPILLMDMDDPEAGLKEIYTCHSEVAELVAMGCLSEEQALHAENRSVITKTLGYVDPDHPGLDLLDDGSISFRTTPMPQNGVLMIGSDGALSQLLRCRMARILLDEVDLGLGCVLDTLIEQVGASGATDDFTVIMDSFISD